MKLKTLFTFLLAMAFMLVSIDHYGQTLSTDSEAASFSDGHTPPGYVQPALSIKPHSFTIRALDANANGFGDDFEDNDLSDWNQLTNNIVYTNTSSDPGEGSISLEANGGQSPTGTWNQGLYNTFPTSQPTSISWMAKATVATNTAHAYFIVGAGTPPFQNEFNGNLAFVYWDNVGDAWTIFTNATGRVIIGDGGSINTWASFELRNIDWVNKNFDLYYNGNLVQTDFPFRDNSINSVEGILLSNFNNTTAFYDDIQVNTALSCTIVPNEQCQDITLSLDNNGMVTLDPAALDNGSTSGCGGSLTFTADIVDFDCSNVGANTVTLTVTDVNGNPSSCTSNVTVESILPEANCTTSSITLTLMDVFLPDGSPNSNAGLAMLTVADIDDGSTLGSCGPTTLSLDRSIFSCIDAEGTGIVPVTLTVTDANGASDQCIVDISVIDNTPPVFISCPGPTISQDNDPGECSAVVNFEAPVAVDNCALETGSLNIDEPNGDDNEGLMFDITNNTAGNIQLRQVRVRHEEVGSTYETVVYAKDGGNGGTLGGAWTFVDGEGPYTADLGRTIQLQPGINVAAGATVGIYVANIAGNQNDYLAFEQPKTFSNGQITIDNPQEISIGNNQTNPLASGNSIVDDEMFDGVVVYFVSTGNPPQTAGLPSGSTFPVGTTVQEFTATDIFGLSSTCDFTVTVNDVEPPSIDFFENNIMLACSASTDPADLGPVIVSDNCTTPDEITISFSDQTSGAVCDGQTIMRTITATDLYNNSVSAIQTILLAPPVAPTINCPDLMIVSCFSDINPSADDATFTTECTDGMVTVSEPVLTSGTADCNGAVYTVTYTVTDGCQQTATCTQNFAIVNNGPTITCAPNQIVACKEDINPMNSDVTVVTACGVDSDIEISPATIIGQDGCDGTTYTFTYTITDGCLRTATCEQVFTLDNAAPVVTIPADETVACASDIVVSTADMTVVQDCPGELTLSVNGPVIDGDANCMGTTYTYTYRAIDDCGRVVNVNRVFTIGDNDLPTIIAPAGYEVTCFAGSAPNPEWATYTTACNNGVEAEVTVSGPVVFGPLDCNGTTYTYTFTVTDACGRTASDFQTVTVVNEGPQISCPAPLQVFGCSEGDYNEVIDAWIETVDASSSCGVDLTINNNFSGNAGICLGNNFTTVNFTATDACGRTSSCQGTITITDTDPPVIYQDPQELLVACNGNTQATFNNWLATQGGAVAMDACWGDQISWSSSVGPNALNCDNGPQAIVVTFTATDGCGNSATTTGIFNTKYLPSTINVNGLIQREDSEPVANVQVGAYLDNGLPVMEMSDGTGDYGFPELDFDENMEIVPEKNDDPLNGLTTWDLVILQQHILGINELDSPYKRIAADINRSGNITTLDLLLLRKLILHIDEEFTDNTSWRFVDADFVFPNPGNPFATEFPEVYNTIGQEEEVADFIAVKIGDLNLDGATYSLMDDGADDRSGLDDLIFEIEDQKLIAGEEYRINVNAQNFKDITGFQFTLNYESGIEVHHIEAGDLVNFDEQNFNLAKRENGAIPMSWNMDRAQDLSSADVAFSVIIQANANVRLSEVLSISSQYTKAEAYQSTDLMNVDLEFTNPQRFSKLSFKLFQNTPNPFKDATTIGFQLPEAGEVSLEVYDVSGRLLHSETGAYAAGYNQIELDQADLPGGVLYYQVNTGKDSDSKKMILMK